MSHQLKLNAVHFSNSLEAEKALLDNSQSTLESEFRIRHSIAQSSSYERHTYAELILDNLVATKSSKKTLSAVSRKSRGTTCITIGVVALVLIIFVWTYMLIKFT
jgi:hypothetical protein